MLIRPPNFPSTLSMKTTIAVSVLLLPALSLNAQLTRKDWLQADEQTVRLKPSAFPSLPSAVRTELEHRGCTIRNSPGGKLVRKKITLQHRAQVDSICTLTDTTTTQEQKK